MAQRPAQNAALGEARQHQLVAAGFVPRIADAGDDAIQR